MPWEVPRVLVWLDHVPDPQLVNVDAEAPRKRPRDPLPAQLTAWSYVDAPGPGPDLRPVCEQERAGFSGVQRSERHDHHHGADHGVCGTSRVPGVPVTREMGELGGAAE
jgi:hypothetical protein